MPCLAGMCGGPVVGIIVGIARGIPSGTYDFYPTWPITLGWYSVVYSIFQFVIFGAIIKAFPGLFGWRTNKKKKASAKA